MKFLDYQLGEQVVITKHEGKLMGLTGTLAGFSRHTTVTNNGVTNEKSEKINVMIKADEKSEPIYGKGTVTTNIANVELLTLVSKENDIVESRIKDALNGLEKDLRDPKNRKAILDSDAMTIQIDLLKKNPGYNTGGVIEGTLSDIRSHLKAAFGVPENYSPMFPSGSALVEMLKGVTEDLKATLKPAPKFYDSEAYLAAVKDQEKSGDLKRLPYETEVRFRERCESYFNSNFRDGESASEFMVRWGTVIENWDKIRPGETFLEYKERTGKDFWGPSNSVRTATGKGSCEKK